MKKHILFFGLAIFVHVSALSQGCLPDGITFTTQAEIDSFQTNYPGCTQIEGNVYMMYWMGTNITNLEGLNVITFIDGDLNIKFNHALHNLSGLENLTAIGGGLHIWNNSTLTSIQALENIDPGSIEDLDIQVNISLSDCHIQSICDYLASPNGSIIIAGNATGCYSVEEVEEACWTGINEQSDQLSFTIQPNPSCNGIITITFENSPSKLNLTCFNTLGQIVHKGKLQAEENVINISNWQAGIYLAVILEDGKPVGKAKFVVGRI